MLISYILMNEGNGQNKRIRNNSLINRTIATNKGRTITLGIHILLRIESEKETKNFDS